MSEQPSKSKLPSFDARDWAQEFMATFGGENRSKIDKELMTTWFASALMTGYDKGRKDEHALAQRYNEASPLTSEEISPEQAKVHRDTLHKIGHILKEVGIDTAKIAIQTELPGLTPKI